MNQVVLTGNLVRDIETRVASGKKVISNCIAVSRDRKNADGAYETDFINIVVWDKQAEYLEAHGHKGDRLEVAGRLQVRTYQTQSGGVATVAEVIVEKISVFAKQQQSSVSTAEKAVNNVTSKNTADIDIDDDDLPF